MKKNKSLFVALVVFGLSGLAQKKTEQVSPALIPAPRSLNMGTGHFTLSKSTRIIMDGRPDLAGDIAWFNDYLERYYQFRLDVSSEPLAGNFIRFRTAADTGLGKEGYVLSIDAKGIEIQAPAGGAGNFYALQSLIQLLPVSSAKDLSIPALRISDVPRFAWRGMHLDACRHFFPLTFVKRYIDLIAMYKMNIFHWHLTDDQGWRIEIKRYPELTRTGAWRKGTMVGRYSDHRYDSTRYGGYYTQEEIKEVVAYAASKHVTVVPEIEMPGHAVAAIASYPWLSCSGAHLNVERGWGVFDDIFCTKDSVFRFLENVLDEVVTLFPGKYIHIGGDEAPKTRWKSCPVCQAVMKREGLKNEQELQSYFIRRIGKYVSSKGRRIIGWDEILEGGLAPDASVMSWQGMEGGMAAASQHHPVVMSPVSHCYFDYYQASPAHEPLAIGGYTPLEKVYAFEPVPATLAPGDQPYVMGAQGNLWTEYILTSQQAEYMVLPRMAALAEVVWSPKEQRNETGFLLRLQKHFALLDLLEYHYAQSIYNIGTRLTPSAKAGSVQLQLEANPLLGEIRYTTDGSKPGPGSARYSEPLAISGDVTITCALYDAQEQKGSALVRNFSVNRATNADITLKTPPHRSYNAGGAFTLVNGESASLPRVNEQWLGWSGQDLEALIRLEHPQEIREVDAGFLNEELSWIYFPREVEVFVSSDGKDFRLAGKATIAADSRVARLALKEPNIQYIKLVAIHYGKIPAGKPGAGEDAWLFCDEIMIR